MLNFAHDPHESENPEIGRCIAGGERAENALWMRKMSYQYIEADTERNKFIDGTIRT